MKPLHKQLTIVAGIIERNNTFLILRRVDTVPQWHLKWEIPGGKIEADEAPLEALHREIFEETGLTIRSAELLGVYTYHWRLPDFTQQTFIITYRISCDNSPIVLRQEENDMYRWVTLQEFFELPDHLQGNKEMISQLYAHHVVRLEG